MNQPITGRDAPAKGQDWTGRWRILAPETVKLTQNAAIGATTLYVEPLTQGLTSGDFLLFGDNTVVELTAAAQAGAVQLTVQTPGGASLAVPLAAAQVGQKIRDLTGKTIEFEVAAEGDDATPIIASSDCTITIANQTAGLRGFVDVTIPAAILGAAAIVPGPYVYALWNRGTNEKRPWAYGPFEIVGLGFL